MKPAPTCCDFVGCAWTTGLSRHHVKPRRDGGSSKAGNLLWVCPNHHSICDRDLIPKETQWWLISLRLGTKPHAE